MPVSRNNTKQIVNMKTLPKFFLLVSMCSSALMVQTSLGENPKKIAHSPEKDSIEGVSMERPILITGAKTYDKVKELQQEYIQTQYEGYSILADIFTMDDNNQKFIQYFILKNEDGKFAPIYFDITDICKASRKSKDKELMERIKILEASKYKSDDTK